MLAAMLSEAGVSWLSASATHTQDGPRNIEVLCRTQEDADAVRRFLGERGMSGTIRVATEQEIKEHDEIVW